MMQSINQLIVTKKSTKWPLIVNPTILTRLSTLKIRFFTRKIECLFQCLLMFLKILKKVQKKTSPLTVIFRGRLRGRLLAGIPAYSCISLHRLKIRKKQKTIDVFQEKHHFPASFQGKASLAQLVEHSICNRTSILV